MSSTNPKYPQLTVDTVIRNFKIIKVLEHPILVIKCQTCGTEKSIDKYRFLLKKTKCPLCDASKKSKLKIGDKFNSLCFVEFVEKRSVKCKCTCSKEVVVDYVALLKGAVKSCGCQSATLRKATNLQKIGAEHYFHSKEFKEVTKKQIFLKSTETKKNNGNTTILQDGRSLWELCKQNNIPPPFVFQLYKQKGEQAAIDYLNSYKGQKVFWTTEKALITLLKEYFPDISKYDKQPKEFKINRRPDFRLELNNKILYINTDGLYSHCCLEKTDNYYHFNLQSIFKNNNQVIFQFREDEIRDKPQIVRSIILNYFGIHNLKLNARDLTIRQIPTKQSNNFFEQNHLMGAFSSSKSYGLTTTSNKLVCSISIRFNKKDNSLEIARFGTLLGTSVRGGFSKLLNYIQNKYKPSKIISFCDLRYSTGQSYEKLNFKLEKVVLSWKWTDFVNTFNRLRCRANMDSRKLPQSEHAKELKWYKIYDAGQAKYVKECR